MQPQNHDARFDGIPEKRLQAFGPSAPKTLQSQTSLRSKNRLLAQWLGKFFTDDLLPHHPRNKPGPAPRRLDFLFQETMGFPADIAGPDIGPGPAFIVAGAGRLAKVIAFAAFQLKILVVAAGAIDG